jgi:hypothetical protein
MSAPEAAIWAQIGSIRESSQEDALRLCLWASGNQLARLAWREHCSERTILNRLDATLDAMRLDDSRQAIGEPAERIEVLN